MSEETAEQMERRARFYFGCGFAVLGITVVAYVIPVTVDHVRSFLGAMIQAFANSPLTRF
jgi:hypothetical protein